MGHGPYNGTSNLNANPPVPTPLKGETYRLLTNWVEKGIAPGNIVLTSASDIPVAKSLPICAYPKKATYVAGDVYAAANYPCADQARATSAQNNVLSTTPEVERNVQ
jgi:hypothetical protein